MTDYNDCPFCLKSLKDRTFYETNFSKAFIAKHSIAEGQAIVIPKRHVEKYEELSEYEIADLNVCCSRVMKLLTVAKNYNDYNLVINIGATAGQSINHIHFHIIPRVKGDIPDPKLWLAADLFSKLKENSSDELVSVAAKLREGLNSLHSIAQYDTANVNVEWSAKNYIANNVRFYGNVTIGKNCIIEDDVVIGISTIKPNGDILKDGVSSVIIASGSIIRSGTLIYEGTKIGENFYCGHNVLIRDNSCIGDNVYVYPSTQIHSNVCIGDCCRISGWIGNNTVVHDNVSSFGQLIHKYSKKIGGVIEAAPTIMENSLIGWNAIVIGGVVIGPDASVGAGSVVTKDVAENDSVMGVPARSKA